MMRLVVEEMRQQHRRRLPIRSAVAADPGNLAVEEFFVEAGSEALDPLVLAHPRRPQLIEIIVKDRVEMGRRCDAALEPGHPIAIADHDVVERAVEAFEKSLPILFALLVREPGAAVVQALVGEPVVARHHLEMHEQRVHRGPHRPSLGCVGFIGKGATKVRPMSGMMLRNLTSAKSPATWTAESAALSTRMRRKWRNSIAMKWHNTVRMMSPWETNNTRRPSSSPSVRITAPTPRAWTSEIHSPP